MSISCFLKDILKDILIFGSPCFMIKVKEPFNGEYQKYLHCFKQLIESDNSMISLYIWCCGLTTFPKNSCVGHLTSFVGTGITGDIGTMRAFSSRMGTCCCKM